MWQLDLNPQTNFKDVYIHVRKFSNCINFYKFYTTKEVLMQIFVRGFKFDI